MYREIHNVIHIIYQGWYQGISELSTRRHSPTIFPQVFVIWIIKAHTNCQTFGHHPSNSMSCKNVHIIAQHPQTPIPRRADNLSKGPACATRVKFARVRPAPRAEINLDQVFIHRQTKTTRKCNSRTPPQRPAYRQLINAPITATIIAASYVVRLLLRPGSDAVSTTYYTMIIYSVAAVSGRERY